MGKKANIYDIADNAGVSAAAVSYVLNGKRKVSEKTKKKILKTMDEMNFAPSTAAISLSTGKSKLIGLCLPLTEPNSFAENPFYMEFIGSFQEEANKRKYDVVIGTIRTAEEFERWMVSRRFDALVIFGFYPKPIFKAIKKRNIPTVLVDVYAENIYDFSTIRVNDERGSYLATDYLIKKGHHKIGFIGGLIKRSVLDQKRFLGYQKAMGEARYPVDPQNIFDTNTTFDGGYSCAEKVIERLPYMTALVCDADIIAIGLMRRFNELGHTVPNDLSIVGFDDIKPSTYIYPPLTTIHQDITEKGLVSAQTLFAAIEGKITTPKTIIIEPTLVERSTVKPIKM
jgi:LacI family transcriptional regulator